MAFRKSTRFGSSRRLNRDSSGTIGQSGLVGNNLEIASTIQERLASRIPDLLDRIVDYVLENLDSILSNLDLSSEVSALVGKVNDVKRDKIKADSGLSSAESSSSDESSKDNNNNKIATRSPSGADGFGNDILKEKNNAKQ